MAPRPPVMPTRMPKKRFGPDRRFICGGGEIVFMVAVGGAPGRRGGIGGQGPV